MDLICHPLLDSLSIFISCFHLFYCVLDEKVRHRLSLLIPFSFFSQFYEAIVKLIVIEDDFHSLLNKKFNIATLRLPLTFNFILLSSNKIVILFLKEQKLNCIIFSVNIYRHHIRH